MEQEPDYEKLYRELYEKMREALATISKREVEAIWAEKYELEDAYYAASQLIKNRLSQFPRPKS